MPSSILINNTKPQKQHKRSSVEEGLITTLLDMVFWVTTDYVHLIMQKKCFYYLKIDMKLWKLCNCKYNFICIEKPEENKSKG